MPDDLAPADTQSTAAEACLALQAYLDAYFGYEQGASLRHRTAQRAGRKLTPDEVSRPSHAGSELRASITTMPPPNRRGTAAWVSLDPLGLPRRPSVFRSLLGGS